MNKSYRSIYNEALGAWVAVSELDAAKGKSNSAGVESLVPPNAGFGNFALKKLVWASITALGLASTPTIYASTVQSGPLVGGVAAGGSACGIGATSWDGFNYTGVAVTDGTGFFSLVAGCSDYVHIML